MKHMKKDKINLLLVVGATNNDKQMAKGDYGVRSTMYEVRSTMYEI